MGSKYSIHSFGCVGCVGGSSCCYLVGVLPVPLVQQVHVVAHGHQRLPQQLQLRRVDLRGDRAVAVPEPGKLNKCAKNKNSLLLCSKIDEVGSHGIFLATTELVHAEGGGHVLVRHLVPDPPPHVHHLVLQPVLLPAVLLDLGVHVLHQGVPLHQHVREGGAREDPDNLILRIVQCHDFAPLLGSGYICIVKLDRTEIQFYKEGKSTANTFALFNLNQSF